MVHEKEGRYIKRKKNDIISLVGEKRGAEIIMSKYTSIITESYINQKTG